MVWYFFVSQQNAHARQKIAQRSFCNGLPQNFGSINIYIYVYPPGLVAASHTGICDEGDALTLCEWHHGVMATLMLWHGNFLVLLELTEWWPSKMLLIFSVVSRTCLCYLAFCCYLIDSYWHTTGFYEHKNQFFLDVFFMQEQVDWCLWLISSGANRRTSMDLLWMFSNVKWGYLGQFCYLLVFILGQFSDTICYVYWKLNSWK
jgi:hypothetical protein